MATKRFIPVEWWDQPEHLAAPPDGKLLRAYFHTNQRTTESGIYTVTVETIAFETGIAVKKVERLLREGKVPYVLYDFARQVVFVVDFREHNGYRPKNDEGLKRVAKSIESDRMRYPSVLWEVFTKTWSSLGQPLGKSSIYIYIKDLISKGLFKDIDIEVLGNSWVSLPQDLERTAPLLEDVETPARAAARKKAELKARAAAAIDYWRSLDGLPQHQGTGYEKEMEGAALHRVERNSDEHVRYVIDWYAGQLADRGTWIGGHKRDGGPWRIQFERVMKGNLSDGKGPIFDDFLERALWDRAQAVDRERASAAEAVAWKVTPPANVTDEERKLWRSVLKSVKGSVEPKEFDTWLQVLRLVSFGETEVVVEVPNGFYKDFICEQYGRVLNEKASAAGGREVSVKVVETVSQREYFGGAVEA